MDLKKHYRTFAEALLYAFNEWELRQLVKFTFDMDLDADVAGGALRNRVFELIGFCDTEGWVDRLFVAALQEKPGNPKLKALAVVLQQDIDSAQQVVEAKAAPLKNDSYENPNAEKMKEAFAEFEANGALQAVVVAAPHLKVGQDVLKWKAGLEQCLTRVCSIAGRKLGTGFLIGPDRIITNSHVIDYGAHSEYDAVFDYVEGTDRAKLPKYTFVKELARSGPREYDYVILQLDKTPAAARGYFCVQPYIFDKIREPVSVLGHPQGNPLTFAYGVVFDANSFMGRVAYTANTSGGSSGSPVFCENWDLVALHHHGEVNVNNHGIPMKSILSDLKGKGLENLLERAA
jgi:hypothetical protein